jgi:transposase-like protein
MEFRRMAVARMSSSDNITALAEELGIDRDLLYRWRGQVGATPATRHQPNQRRKIHATPNSVRRTAC